MDKNTVICISRLGDGPNAVILEIGIAVVGAPYALHVFPDLQTQLDRGAVVSGERLSHWLSRPGVQVDSGAPGCLETGLTKPVMDRCLTGRLWFEPNGDLETLTNLLGCDKWRGSTVKFIGEAARGAHIVVPKIPDAHQRSATSRAWYLAKQVGAAIERQSPKADTATTWTCETWDCDFGYYS